ncbi:unnamed protein product [Rhizophagus irregularis]|nr:unnamed protein product [Rhizophagus irregularis]
MVNNRIRPDEESKSLKSDQEDLSNYLAKIIEEVGIDIKELSNEFTSMVLKVNAMNNTMEKLLDEQTKQQLKLRMSLDIARGLNFLRAVEIVHRDIRAENILITLHETAKLANFKLSRSLFAPTLNQRQNLERNYRLKPLIMTQNLDRKLQIHLNPEPTPNPEPIPSPESIINQDEYAIKTLSDYESFKYMTLAEAAKQHKIFDRQVAKYYKAYYISRGLVEGLKEIKDKDKDRIVAELYKEVADDEANEFPEAKLR